jgi:hypothetical protein
LLLGFGGTGAFWKNLELIKFRRADRHIAEHHARGEHNDIRRQAWIL